MNNEVYVGIDLARTAKHKAVVVVKQYGRTITNKRKGCFSFGHDLEGFIGLRDYILKEGKLATLESVQVNMEPTSGVWEMMANFLRGEGAKVYFTSTLVVSSQRKANSRYAKTDRLDAWTLATMIETLPEKLVPVVTLDEPLVTIRVLSSQRARLVDDCTRWKNRMLSELEKGWQPLLMLLSKNEKFSRLGREFFRHFSKPEDVLKLGQNRFAHWCESRMHRNSSLVMIEKLWKGSVKSQELWSYIENKGTMFIAWETSRKYVEQCLRSISSLKEEIESIEKQISELSKAVPEIATVMQLPGVAEIIGAGIVARIAPVNRFSSTKKVGAYTGYVSRKDSSGQRDSKGLPITKAANKILKHYLALAADTAMRMDPQLAQFAINLLRRGKHYNKVRVAIGRKIGIRAYSLLKRLDEGEETTYYWRDLSGKTITKKRAVSIARELWKDYKAEKDKNKRIG